MISLDTIKYNTNGSVIQAFLDWCSLWKIQAFNWKLHFNSGVDMTLDPF